MKSFRFLAAFVLFCLTLSARSADEAMRPLYGSWSVDLDATMKENVEVSERFRAKAKLDLEANPFTLKITETEYISTSRLKTITDQYRFAGEKNGTITINLLGADGNRGAELRTATLIPKNDQLLIRIDSPHFIVVLKRLPAEKGVPERETPGKGPAAK